jgi:hypothetical protein
LAESDGSLFSRDWRDQKNASAKLVFGFASVGQIKNDSFAIAFFAVVFIEDRLRDHVLFAGPISEVAFAASFAAKWKIGMHRGIGGGFTYRAFVFHIVLPGCNFFPRLRAIQVRRRGIHLDAERWLTDSLNRFGGALLLLVVITGGDFITEGRTS